MIKAGIIGATGYAGGELVRLGEVLKRHELCGRGGVKYFLDQWNLLNEKYSK